MNIDFTFDLLMRAFFCQGEPVVCHSALCLLVSGSYPNTHDPSPVLTLSKRFGSVCKRSNSSLKAIITLFILHLFSAILKFFMPLRNTCFVYGFVPESHPKHLESLGGDFVQFNAKTEVALDFDCRRLMITGVYFSPVLLTPEAQRPLSQDSPLTWPSTPPTATSLPNFPSAGKNQYGYLLDRPCMFSFENTEKSLNLLCITNSQKIVTYQYRYKGLIIQVCLC